jgi:hypothetical protein
MDDQEIAKRLEEISDQLDELTKVAKENTNRVEATFKVVGEVKAHFNLDISDDRPLGITAGDRVSYVGQLGNVVAVGPSVNGPQAVIAFDGADPETGYFQALVQGLVRLDAELAP